MELKQLSEIELLSIQTKLMKDYKQIEYNLNLINQEIQNRVSKFEETKKEEIK